jgi:hypothetical protein
MKIRGLLAGLLVAASLTGCGRSATAPEAPRSPVSTAPVRDDSATPPDTTTAPASTERGGGALGSGH